MSNATTPAEIVERALARAEPGAYPNTVVVNHGCDQGRHRSLGMAQGSQSLMKEFGQGLFRTALHGKGSEEPSPTVRRKNKHLMRKLSLDLDRADTGSPVDKANTKPRATSAQK